MNNTITALTGNSGVLMPTPGTSPSPPRTASTEKAPPPAEASLQKVEKPDEKKASQPTHETLQNAVNHANKVLEAKAPSEARFSVDKDTGITVVKLLDKETGETIRQIPNQEMLEIAKSIDSQLKGRLIKQQA